jgi:hypothetical protein
MSSAFENLDSELAQAVRHYWLSREKQAGKQQQTGRSDQGARGAVTGGKQMDGFVQLITGKITDAGIEPDCLHYRSRLELPGFFRPTKKWDILVVKADQLVAAIEVKSQAGPSYGNNFNNRAEEALGSATDLWTAYREGSFNRLTRPWLGYVIMLESSPVSERPVKVEEPHFKVFPEFKGASYARRYELLCRKLVRERHYDATAFLFSSAVNGRRGQYSEPADDLTMMSFLRSLIAQVKAYAVE